MVLEATTDDTLEGSRVHVKDGVRVLRSAAVYGPNASGKSSLIDAMSRLRGFVLFSARADTFDDIPVEPFLLSDETVEAPTTVEWQFLCDGSRYRYGFVADRKKVHAEWLFRRTGKVKESTLFTRENQKIEPNLVQFKESLVLKKLEKEAGNSPVRENALALSVYAQFNGQISTRVVRWFDDLRKTSGLSERGHFSYTARRLNEPDSQEKLLSFAQRADFNINGLSAEIREEPRAREPNSAIQKVAATLAESNRRLVRPEIKTAHPRYDINGNVTGNIEFDLAKQESQGTQKFIAISGPLHRTIEEGSILVIDEFEARLHPLLTRAIFEWFHGPENQGTAQLIVATHDVGLMDPESLRRDQIWFCDKDRQGATSLYSLAEFDVNAVRPTTKFSRQYLLGLLGAVPKIALSKEDLHE